MANCIHSAVAPNMNRCIVCGMIWAGSRWESAPTEVQTTTPPNAPEVDVLAAVQAMAEAAASARWNNRTYEDSLTLLLADEREKNMVAAVAELITREAALVAERDVLKAALEKIANLDPANTEEGFNEWGEAKCFEIAWRTAKETLEPATEPPVG